MHTYGTQGYILNNSRINNNQREAILLQDVFNITEFNISILNWKLKYYFLDKNNLKINISVWFIDLEQY